VVVGDVFVVKIFLELVVIIGFLVLASKNQSFLFKLKEIFSLLVRKTVVLIRALVLLTLVNTVGRVDV
jgi:hypothetical protein